VTERVVSAPGHLEGEVEFPFRWRGGKGREDAIPSPSKSSGQPASQGADRGKKRKKGNKYALSFRGGE